MIDDPDILRAAKPSVDQHGDDAAIRAAQWAHALAGEADLVGAMVQRRILEAIDALTRIRRKGESLNRFRRYVLRIRAGSTPEDFSGNVGRGVGMVPGVFPITLKLRGNLAWNC